MAKPILKLLPLSSNDITHLSKAFLMFFEHRYRSNLPLEHAYAKPLALTLGLGFSAVLEDAANWQIASSWVDDYLKYLEYLGLYNSCDFMNHPELFERSSAAIAEMIARSLACFHSVGYPAYYPHFISALKEVIGCILSGNYGEFEVVHQQAIEELLKKFDIK